MGFYEQVREENVVKYGTRVSNYIPIIINQYSDRTHFIYEIIQNAEDAGATYIKFHLHRDRLAITHNGRPFNEKDVNGVCGIADGTKADGTRIGHFGIGFKAVYGYTTTPEIYSGNFCFKIVDYLNPYEISKMTGLPSSETCLVLPFDKSTVAKEVAYKEIREALTKKITAESIMMLNSVVDVEIDIEGNSDVITINKEKGSIDGSNNVFDVSLLTTHESKINRKRSEIESNYIFFTDAEEKATAIVFKVNGKEIQEIKNNKIYAFFPMAIESHQSFYIHAPFDTNPARNEILQGEDFGRNNFVLINNICRLITFAFIWLRDNGYLSFSGLNKVYPIYEYEESNILYAIYQNSIDIIREGEPILPTNMPGIYKSIKEICVPGNMGITGVFSDDDLKTLTGNRNLFWISKEIQTTEYAGFKAFLDRNFEFKTYEWRHLILSMTAAFLKSKKADWMELLMYHTESFCTKRGPQQSHYIDVSKIPLVRLNTGEQICARENGKLLVYLNNPAVCKYKISTEFLQRTSIRSFYERALNIPVYDLERETIDKILPKYVTRNVDFKTDNPIKENIEDLKEIKDAIVMNPAIIEQIADKYVVTDGKDWYRPSELYIRSMDSHRTGYALVRGVVEIKYLTEKYFDDTVMSIKLDEDFFRKIGCSLGLRVVQVTKNDYLRAVSHYIDNKTAKEIDVKVLSKSYVSKKWDWTFCFEGFPEVFKEMTPQKSKDIAKFVNGNIQKFDIQGDLVGANDQHFNGSSVDSVVAYSMLGLMLCFEKWIYINGNPEPQRPLDIDKEDIISGYEPAKRLINLLPFKEVKNALYEYFETIYKDKGDIDLVRRMMADPDEFLKLAKAKAKSDAKIAAQESKKAGLKERYEKGDKGQLDGDKKPADGIEVNPISERGLAKREAKLEEELIDSLGKKPRIARGLSHTIKSCNKDERLFLEVEYGGVCQICQKSIRKWNGDSYFEAVNIIKPHELYDHLANSMGLGWNSLSLCPNCAAEYNYCSKKISTFYEQVMATDIEPGSEEPIEIFIEIPEGKERRIIYSPRHFLALKKAFELFANEE